MHFAFTAVSVLFAVARGEFVHPRKSNNSTIRPWVISALDTFSPSGCTSSCPNSSLAFTITDPNTIPAGQTETGEQIVFPPSTTKCSASWPAHWNIWGEIFNCSDIADGQWVFIILQPEGTTTGGSPTEDFDVDITLGDIVELPGSSVWKTFEGRAHFEVGVNLGGRCGNGGGCHLHLDKRAAEVNQTLVECSGYDCTLTVEE